LRDRTVRVRLFFGAAAAHEEQPVALREADVERARYFLLVVEPASLLSERRRIEEPAASRARKRRPKSIECMMGIQKG
jgi:hypothetical protein